MKDKEKIIKRIIKRFDDDFPTKLSFWGLGKYDPAKIRVAIKTYLKEEIKQ